MKYLKPQQKLFESSNNEPIPGMVYKDYNYNLLYIGKVNGKYPYLYYYINANKDKFNSTESFDYEPINQSYVELLDINQIKDFIKDFENGEYKDSENNINKIKTQMIRNFYNQIIKNTEIQSIINAQDLGLF